MRTTDVNHVLNKSLWKLSGYIFLIQGNTIKPIVCLNRIFRKGELNSMLKTDDRNLSS